MHSLIMILTNGAESVPAYRFHLKFAYGCEIPIFCSGMGWKPLSWMIEEGSFVNRCDGINIRLASDHIQEMSKEDASTILYQVSCSYHVVAHRRNPDPQPRSWIWHRRW